MSKVVDKFDVDRVSEYFEECLNFEEVQVQLEKYILAYREINKLLDQLGSIFTFVKDDVESKCLILEKHCKGPNGTEYGSVTSMVHFEICRGIIEPEISNTKSSTRSNNHFSIQDGKQPKEEKQSKSPTRESICNHNHDNESSTNSGTSRSNNADLKKEWKINNNLNVTSYTDLPSGSRSLLRLHRALSFVIQLFPTILNSDPNQTSSIRHGIKNLYDQTLAAFHPWIVQKAVHLALFAACPSRQSLLSIIVYDGSTDDLKKKCERLTSVGQQVISSVQKTYEENGILNLQ